jgi:hypothetical protein
MPLCACGCGVDAGVYRKSSLRGLPRKFIHGHHNRNPGVPYRIEDRGYTTPCWIWRWALDKDGYARQWNPGGSNRAHRVFYEEHVGPIPEGMVIDHLCRECACVNPDHLEPVTIRENTLRGEGLSSVNSRKTHCLRGHAYDAANTYVDPRGERACRTCKREDARRRRAAA